MKYALISRKLPWGSKGRWWWRLRGWVGAPIYADATRKNAGSRSTTDGVPACRPVVMTCGSFGDKIQILKNKSKLKGLTIGLDEDLTNLQRENIRAQWPAMLEARKEGKSAVFRADKLIIRSTFIPKDSNVNSTQ